MSLWQQFLEWLASLFSSVSNSSTSGSGSVSSMTQETTVKTTSVQKSPAWNKYNERIKAHALAWDLDWKWIKAILLCETLLGTDGTYLSNGKGSFDGKSWGLAQFQPSTATEVAGYVVTSTQLANNDELSISLCAQYLNKLRRQFNGDVRKTIMSYNQGPGNTVAGKQYAAAYFERWERWMDVLEGEP